jgi:hypothetical protein
VSAPGAGTFSRIWKIRHQRFPKRRLFADVFWKGKLVKPMVATATEWSYPAAIEQGGNLYITYTQVKEDAALSIIPMRCLAVSCRLLKNASFLCSRASQGVALRSIGHFQHLPPLTSGGYEFFNRLLAATDGGGDILYAHVL